MNPVSIDATNYRTFERLHLDLPAGCLAIVGENGAGKSSIVNVIDLALFGPEGRSLADYLTDDASASELEIELTFEHASELYRVRRGFSAKGRGKTTLDFERNRLNDREDEIGLRPDSWIPETRESQKETQDAISQCIGLTRETFRASAFLAQGDGAAFTEAVPRDRKRILADVLGLKTWETLLEACRVDKRKTERESSELAGRISHLEESGSGRLELEESCSRLRLLVSESESEHAQAERALDEAAVAVRELEKAEASYRVRGSAVRTAEAILRERQTVVDRAAQAKLEAVEVQRELDSLFTAERLEQAEDEQARLNDRISDEEHRIRLYGEAFRARDAALARRADLVDRVETLIEEAVVLREQASHVLDHIGSARCDRCEQVLGTEAARIAAASLGTEAAAKDKQAYALDREAEAVEILDPGPEPQRDLQLDQEHKTIVAAIATIRAELVQRAAVEQKLAGLQATIAEVTPELTAEVARLAEELVTAEEALASVDEPEPGALEVTKAAALTAKAGLDHIAAMLTETRANLIRAEAALEQARKIAAELESARAHSGKLEDELDLLALLERAYGRDGIPALIVESSAIPSIETEANRILAELGTSYRVELRTQKALKSGDGLADTLDVVVIADAGERAYETFSGGERTRINLALRIALARLLAHRRGAESRLLAIDEPEFLDEAGTAALAEVLRNLDGEFERIVLVSHVPTLRDAFDQTLEVIKDGNRSVVVA